MGAVSWLDSSPTNHLGGLRTASALCVALEPWLLPCEKEGLAPIARVVERFESDKSIAWPREGAHTQACWEALQK